MRRAESGVCAPLCCLMRDSVQLSHLATIATSRIFMRPSMLLLFSMLSLGPLAGCKREPPAAQDAAAPAASEAVASAPAAITELKRDDVQVGRGEPIANGQIAVVHYTGWLYDPAAPEQKGAKFDSSRDRGQPFRFPLGAGRVIQGWDQGVLGMQVGGQRRLTIPSDLGYGAQGAGPIPPGATLLFEVELLGVE
jgi:FKBP-type peptidyl-prolyl cis-trans isomerase